jgi:glutaminyl-tRNA synthetase
MMDPPKKYFRLAPGRTVRLRGGYCVTCKDVVTDAAGTITEIICEHIPGTIGANPPEGIQCRAAIHWVSVPHAVNGEVRIYDRLFTSENPDGEEAGFLSVLNPNSLQVIKHAKLEPSLAEVEPEFRCQFERIGYFVSDRRDHVAGQKPVFNRTVALKDSWAKKNK